MTFLLTVLADGLGDLLALGFLCVLLAILDHRCEWRAPKDKP